MTENFKDQFEQDKKEHNIGGGDWFKLLEGDNKFRILTQPLIVVEKWKVGICYEDCGYCGKDATGLSTKYLTYIIDRRDGKIKLFKLPYKITKQIIALMGSDEYKADDFPLPYDLNIQADDKVGTKAVSYTLVAARKNTKVTGTELEELETKTPTEQVIESMKSKQKSKVEGAESASAGMNIEDGEEKTDEAF